ncbi:hypothetical protein BDY17DRAFT_313723 [Neohortaea acidophila]|uniref:Uncharacterized protein n=1 Tax=Neohortaea acidophila TaxID=245834 RepID=A0A6A6PGN8_9PEZI|nr:uncharacterized protein BDY17DRAFT_313723 [Neohortaea acidophila]KAF2479158.1 hypothetical protein BDY17DRAFT_313723 [Neohortaea acidophila]
MRATTILFALLAAVATASDKHLCTKTVHGKTKTVTKTSTTYASTTTLSSTITSGIITSTTTTTTTTPAFPLNSCIAPADVPKKREALPKWNTWRPDKCWGTTTVTKPAATKTVTVTVSAVSTVQKPTTVPSATTTSIVTSIATAAVSSFAGPFLIVDPTDTTYFTLEELGIDSAYVSLQPLSDANYFSLQDGSLTVEDSSNYELYADPAYATIADDYIGGEYGPTTVFAFNTTDYQGETALSCSITQNSDQTCPLTCTGNGGSQFYYCPSAADGPEPTVLLGPANTAGKNCGSTPVLFSAFVVGPEV